MQDNDEFNSKCRINNDSYYVVPLHERPELIDECCRLINLEWKRSHVARLRSISGSSKNFPTSLLLLTDSGKTCVIGHCKLSRVSHSSPVVFLETVVIHPKYRGIGLGKLLMRKTEQYLKRQYIDWIYLSTMGQEMFYEKLGYSVCQPINIYGGQFHCDDEDNNNESATSPISKFSNGKECPVHSHSLQNKPENLGNGQSIPQKICVDPESPLPPPPPPPPPMPSSFPASRVVVLNNKKIFMRKRVK